MQAEPTGELGSKHHCNAEPLYHLRESEAPAELSTPRFGRSLTLPLSESASASLDCGK